MMHSLGAVFALHAAIQRSMLDLAGGEGAEPM